MKCISVFRQLLQYHEQSVCYQFTQSANFLRISRNFSLHTQRFFRNPQATHIPFEPERCLAQVSLIVLGVVFRCAAASTHFANEMLTSLYWSPVSFGTNTPHPLAPDARRRSPSRCDVIFISSSRIPMPLFSLLGGRLPVVRFLLMMLLKMAHGCFGLDRFIDLSFYCVIMSCC